MIRIKDYCTRTKGLRSCAKFEATTGQLRTVQYCRLQDLEEQKLYSTCTPACTRTAEAVLDCWFWTVKYCTSTVRYRITSGAGIYEYCTSYSNYRALQIAKSLRIGTRAPVGLSTPPAPRRSRTGDVLYEYSCYCNPCCTSTVLYCFCSSKSCNTVPYL